MKVEVDVGSKNVGGRSHLDVEERRGPCDEVDDVGIVVAVEFVVRLMLPRK